MLYWDDGHRNALRGFGVLCSGKTSSRTFVAQRDMPGGRTRRVTIGGVTELTLSEARDRAASGRIDPRPFARLLECCVWRARRCVRRYANSFAAEPGLPIKSPDKKPGLNMLGTMCGMCPQRTGACLPPAAWR